MTLLRRLDLRMLTVSPSSARLGLSHCEMIQIGLDAPASQLNDHMSLILERGHELQNGISKVKDCLGELSRLGLTRWLPITA